MAGFTYSEVGATRGRLPDGYHHVRASRVLGAGDEVFDQAVERLMSWDMQRGSGIRVEATSPKAIEGAEVVMRWLGQRIPCQVVYAVDEPDRQGFAYGTLRGHPECGEERFLIERDRGTGEVRAVVTGFSKPGSLRTRLIGPFGRLIQRAMTNRYLDAL